MDIRHEGYVVEGKGKIGQVSGLIQRSLLGIIAPADNRDFLFPKVFHIFIIEKVLPKALSVFTQFEAEN